MKIRGFMFYNCYLLNDNSCIEKNCWEYYLKKLSLSKKQNKCFVTYSIIGVLMEAKVWATVNEGFLSTIDTQYYCP